MDKIYFKNWPVRFYKSETKKIEPNSKKKTSKTEKKPSQTEKPIQTGKNRAKPVWTGFYLKNWIETGRFELILIFFKKI
jgi:hypothetical protein